MTQGSFVLLTVALAVTILVHTTTFQSTTSERKCDDSGSVMSKWRPHSPLEFTVNQTEFFLQVWGASSSSQDHDRDTEDDQLDGNHDTVVARRQQQHQVQESKLSAPWLDTDLPLCRRNDIVDGKWVRTELERAPYITDTVHLRCYDKKHFLQRPFPTWKWSPRNPKCDFTKFRQSLFCKVARHATIMVVGDSLSWEHYSSLVQMTTNHPIHQGFQHQSKLLDQNIVHTGCPSNTDNGQNGASTEYNTVRLVYRRDDRLLNLAGALEQDFPTVLILNRGAHYKNDTTLLEEMEPNWQIIRDWLYQCKHVHGVKCHLFWRTTVPGHPKCGTFSEPANDLKAMEAYIADLDNYNSRSIEYHWYDYQHQNKLMLQELERQIGSDYSYGILDAYYLNVLRPDEHRAHQNDCLHSCYPGKMDVLTRLLLHYLRASTSMEDVTRRGVVRLKKSTAGDTRYEKQRWMEEDKRQRQLKKRGHQRR